LTVSQSSVAPYSLNNVMRVTKLGPKFPYLVLSLMVSPYLNFRVMCWLSIDNSIRRSPLPPKHRVRYFQKMAITLKVVGVEG